MHFSHLLSLHQVARIYLSLLVCAALFCCLHTAFLWPSLITPLLPVEALLCCAVWGRLRARRERIAARRFGVADIRDFYRNDVRFLEQF